MTAAPGLGRVCAPSSPTHRRRTEPRHRRRGGGGESESGAHPLSPPQGERNVWKWITTAKM